VTSVGALPETVRARILALAAERLAALPEEEVPARLRRVRTFTPAKRARLGAVLLAAVVEQDSAFRAAVVAGLRADTDPGGPAEGDAEAAVAWLRQAPGWEALVEQANQRAVAAEALAGERADSAEVARLRRQVTGLAAEAKARGREHAAQVLALQASVAEARRRSRPVEAAARRVEADAEARVQALTASLATASAAAASAEATAVSLRARGSELEAALAAARKSARGERGAEDARVRVLLDTVLSAGQGLRRVLALGVEPGEAPGDTVVAALGVTAAADGAVVTDPQTLDALLALPTVHVVVDGYNVTKTGYGALALESQRARLLAGLAALVARTGAEVTVVFDGAGRPPLSAPGRGPSGVRVAWSPPGTTADDVVLQFVSAEPVGRPVLVVSSDGEVVTGARRRGARPVASAVLLARLDRA